MLRPPSLSNILLRFGSLNFWLIILICHRYSYVFLWFLVGFHGFQGIFMLLSFPHFHFLPFAMINRKMLLVNNWQFCSGSPDASMSTVLLPPYFHFLSLTTKKSILIVSMFRLSWCFNVNSALAFSIILLAIVYKDKENQFWLSQCSGSPDASMSTVLWAKTQQLQEDAFRQLQNIYGEKEKLMKIMETFNT